jgi:hypothetical protein
MRLKRSHQPADPTAMRPRLDAEAVPWVVTLVISGLLVTPFMLGAHWRHGFSVTGKVFSGLILWIALAAFFRFIVFLADYFRWGSKRKWAHASPDVGNPHPGVAPLE